jgi:hypothetical protein
LERDKTLKLRVIKNRIEIHFSVPREWIAENVWFIEEVTRLILGNPSTQGNPANLVTWSRFYHALPQTQSEQSSYEPITFNLLLAQSELSSAKQRNDQQVVDEESQ